jgi:hypothetical protein
MLFTKEKVKKRRKDIAMQFNPTMINKNKSTNIKKKYRK